MSEESYLCRESFPGVPAMMLGRESDGACIPLDLANQDYQAFLTWLAEGNPAPEGWTGPLNPTPEEVA